MLEDLDSVAWDSKPQPEWNAPGAVSAAIRRLAAVGSQQTAEQAYNQFLFAVGNNHSGTCYPVVLDAVPFVGRILQSSNPWARIAVLDAFIDLLGSFAPEPGYEFVESANGTTSLRARLRQSIADFSSTFVALSTDPNEPARARQLARDILDLLGKTNTAL